jgi:hypothetical protein
MIEISFAATSSPVTLNTVIKLSVRKPVFFLVYSPFLMAIPLLVNFPPVHPKVRQSFTKRASFSNLECFARFIELQSTKIETI